MILLDFPFPSVSLKSTFNIALRRDTTKIHFLFLENKNRHLIN